MKSFNRYARRMTSSALLTMSALASTGGSAQAQIRVEPNHPNALRCASSANDTEMAKIPLLASDLELLKQLPLTGMPIYRALKNPEYKIQACLVAAGYKLFNGKTLIGGAYSHADNKLFTVEVFSASASYHEAFHAIQGQTKPPFLFNDLTKRDAAMYFLLMEATAAAYEMVLQQEAINHQVPLRKSGMQTSSTLPANVAVFQAFYSKALNLYSNEDPATRERWSLQGAGQSYVLYLLSGKDAHWRASYEQTIIEQFANKTFKSEEQAYNDKNYFIDRNKIFKSAGDILDKIELMPFIYGWYSDADPFIDKVMSDMKLTFNKKPDTAPQKKIKP